MDFRSSEPFPQSHCLVYLGSGPFRELSFSIRHVSQSVPYASAQPHGNSMIFQYQETSVLNAQREARHRASDASKFSQDSLISFVPFTALHLSSNTLTSRHRVSASALSPFPSNLRRVSGAWMTRFTD